MVFRKEVSWEHFISLCLSMIIFQLNCKLHLIADDTVIYISEKAVNILIETINQVLQNVNKWFTENALIVNRKKSKYMLITNNTIACLNQDIFLWVTN